VHCAPIGIEFLKDMNMNAASDSRLGYFFQNLLLIKSAYDFLLVINTNLHPVSLRFVQSEPLNLGLRNLALKNRKHRSIVWY